MAPLPHGRNHRDEEEAPSTPALMALKLMLIAITEIIMMTKVIICSVFTVRRLWAEHSISSNRRNDPQMFFYYYGSATDEEAETERGRVTRARTHSWEGRERQCAPALPGTGA